MGVVGSFWRVIWCVSVTIPECGSLEFSNLSPLPLYPPFSLVCKGRIGIEPTHREIELFYQAKKSLFESQFQTPSSTPSTTFNSTKQFFTGKLTSKLAISGFGFFAEITTDF